MTPKQAWAMARDGCPAWNRRDLDAILARYAEDVVLTSPAVVRRFER
jgi:ketosteroid isomerase-like protein